MRHILAILLAIGITALPSAADQSPPQDGFNQDFDYAWRTIASMYCYITRKRLPESDVPRLYDSDLHRVTTREEFIGLLERVLDELYPPVYMGESRDRVHAKSGCFCTLGHAAIISYYSPASKARC